MKLKPYINKHLIRVGLGQENAELVIRGGRMVNVFTLETYPADIAIADGRIAAVGDVSHCTGPATQIYDATGFYIAPGLIDPHLHPEVSKLELTRLAESLLAHGTTTIMTSLDQVGVINGIEGIRFCLDQLGKTPLKAFYNGPSRLPYTTPASTIAHHFSTTEHAGVASWDETTGMWEYMIESIVGMEEPVLEAANALLDSGRRPQGHLPFTRGPWLAGAMAAGVVSDHESWTADEVAEKLRAGLFVMLRKASSVDNIREGLRAVTEMGLPTRRLSLCADDIDCTDLTELGHMDHYVRYAISLGIDPLQAIQMCSLTAAEAYRVDHLVGSITPGRCADLVLVPDLKDFQVEQVFADGRLVAKNGKILEPLPHPVYPPEFYTTMHDGGRSITEAELAVPAPAGAKRAKVIVLQLDPSQVRIRREVVLPIQEGCILSDPVQDVNYISVTDRHSGKMKTATAFIGGTGLKKGAFASSLSPDDDNIICIGSSLADMACATRRLFEIKGGWVVVADQTVQAEIALPIAGIMADLSAEEMAAKEAILQEKLVELGVNIPKPFFSMIFLSITAIPEYAITDGGLTMAATRDYVNPVLETYVD